MRNKRKYTAEDCMRLLFYQVSGMEKIREWRWTSLDALLNIEYQQLLFLNGEQHYFITDMIQT